jgi:hypothetical protein
VSRRHIAKAGNVEGEGLNPLGLVVGGDCSSRVTWRVSELMPPASWLGWSLPCCPQTKRLACLPTHRLDRVGFGVRLGLGVGQRLGSRCEARASVAPRRTESTHILPVVGMFGF